MIHNLNPQPDTQDQQEPQEDQEEEPEEDTDETIPYGSTDTDDTLDYTDLVIDDSKWCFLSQEQKLCSNTASFSVPRLIDGSPVALSSVESSKFHWYVLFRCIGETTHPMP